MRDRRPAGQGTLPSRRAPAPRRPRLAFGHECGRWHSSPAPRSGKCRPDAASRRNGAGGGVRECPPRPEASGTAGPGFDGEGRFSCRQAGAHRGPVALGRASRPVATFPRMPMKSSGFMRAGAYHFGPAIQGRPSLHAPGADEIAAMPRVLIPAGRCAPWAGGAGPDIAAGCHLPPDADEIQRVHAGGGLPLRAGNTGPAVTPRARCR